MSRRLRFLILCMSNILFIVLIWIIGNHSRLQRSSLLIRKSTSNSGWNLEFLPPTEEPEANNDQVQNTSESGSQVVDEADTIANKTVVLMWTKYYNVNGSSLMSAILYGRKWDSDCCTGNDLIVTLDRNLLPWATVVVFFNYFHNLNKNDLPSPRPPGQLWVVFSKESSMLSLSLSQFPDLFNWTMSYRLDSDIWSPYGMTVPLESPVAPIDPILMPGDIPLSQWIANKTDILAGVISHCSTNSRRERLVAALQNYSLPVDIYGGCGNRKTCPRGNLKCDHEKFWRGLASTYKFYFAAENSLCVDYITEKFWRALDLGMVPLAYGGANYTAVAPPNSFIDVGQFQSVQEMVEYLQRLSLYPIEYAKYFEWKRNYKVILPDGWGGWCKLCHLAKQYKNNNIAEMEVSPYKTYESLSSWWQRAAIGSEQSACVNPSFHT